MDKPDRLFNSDLIENPKKYSLKELEDNLGYVSSKVILKTQLLDADFCAKYILVVDIDSGDEDWYNIDVDDILEAQPHINPKDLYAAIEREEKELEELKKKNKKIRTKRKTKTIGY